MPSVLSYRWNLIGNLSAPVEDRVDELGVYAGSLRVN